MPRLVSLSPRVRLAPVGRVKVLTVSGSQRVRGAELRRLKRLVAARSGGLCECSQCASARRRLPASEYDHIIPLWEGGGDGLDNLQHINPDCHRAKSAAEHRRRLGLDPLPGA